MPIVDQDAPKVTPDPAANPRDSWPDWTDEDRWEADGYTPTFDEEAEEAGYQAGLEGAGPCSSPTSWPGAARMAFATGRQRGVRERERAARDEAEHEAWLDQAYDALHSPRDRRLRPGILQLTPHRGTDAPFTRSVDMCPRMASGRSTNWPSWKPK